MSLSNIPTDTLENHVLYTRFEFTSSPYYMSVLNFLKSKNIETMMDLGGCTGETTIIMFEGIPSLRKSVILEPIAENYNFILNRINKSEELRDKVLVLDKAIFYGKDKLDIGMSHNGVGSWTMTSQQNISSIETITLEEIQNRYGQFDFVKVDIEGAETNLIENSSLLQNIKYLEIEFHRNLILSENWKPYVAKYLPNHQILFGGQDGRNQDGSVFLIRR